MHKPKGHNSAENNWNRTIFGLILCILLTHLYSEFQLKRSMNDRDNERTKLNHLIFLSQRSISVRKIIWSELNLNLICVFLWLIYFPNFNWKYPFKMEKMSNNQIYWNFWNYSTRTKFKLDLHIFMTNMYIEFQFKMSIYDKDKEWKPRYIGIFVSPRGVTLLDFELSDKQFLAKTYQFYHILKMVTNILYTALNSPSLIFALMTSETDSPSVEFAHFPVLSKKPLYIIPLV